MIEGFRIRDEITENVEYYRAMPTSITVRETTHSSVDPDGDVWSGAVDQISTAQRDYADGAVTRLHFDDGGTTYRLKLQSSAVANRLYIDEGTLKVAEHCYLELDPRGAVDR